MTADIRLDLFCGPAHIGAALTGSANTPDSGELQRRLTEELPGEPLHVLFRRSRSEANDLALQLAMAATGNSGFILCQAARFGDTAALRQLASDQMTSAPRFALVRHVPPPGPPGAFARSVSAACADLAETGRGVAGVLIDPSFMEDGLPDYLADDLSEALAIVRRARGLVISDQSIAGLGRGGARWAQPEIGAEIVTIGRSLGNGFPVAAVLSAEDPFQAFAACGFAPPVAPPSHEGGAAASAVLDWMDGTANRNAMSDAAETLRSGLAEAVDLRGREMLWAFDRDTPAAARTLRERLADQRIRVGQTGRTILLRPPLSMSVEDAEQAARTICEALGSL